MKILSIGNFGVGWDGSICDEEHIAQALEELGHEVIRMQREDLLHPSHPDVAGQSLPPCDFVLIAQWDGYGDALEALRLYKLVYWAFDYQADGQEWHEQLVKGADLYLSKRIADSKYPNWQWLSQDFAPEFLDKYPDPHEKLGGEIEVLFTGSYLPWATERNETLKAVDDTFNLVIHSVNEWPGFKDVRPPIMDEGLPELYAKAKVILSIDHTLEAGYWSDRNFQAMCCGGYVLFRYIPLSENTFGSGVDYFYSVDDCLDKIQNALDNPEHREFVAKVGYNYATWLNRGRVSAKVYDLLTIVRSIL